MFEVRTGLQAVAYTLVLLVGIVGGGLFIAWLSPFELTDPVVVRKLVPGGLTAVLIGVGTWRIQQRNPKPSLDMFLDSVPRAAWMVFAGGHGVVLGTVLALLWQAPFMPMMLGFGAVAALAGAFLPKLRRVR